MIDLDKMEAGARAALNRDAWFAQDALLETFVTSNALHIANCSPPNILALIERVRGLKEYIKGMREQIGEDATLQAESKGPWRKIDMDDPETWPQRTPPFTQPVLFCPKDSKAVNDYALGTIWLYDGEPRVLLGLLPFELSPRSVALAEFSHWKPAHIPEPPKST